MSSIRDSAKNLPWISHKKRSGGQTFETSKQSLLLFHYKLAYITNRFRRLPTSFWQLLVAATAARRGIAAAATLGTFTLWYLKFKVLILYKFLIIYTYSTKETNYNSQSKPIKIIIDQFYKQGRYKKTIIINDIFWQILWKPS